MNKIVYSETVKSMQDCTSRLEREGDYWEQYEKDQLAQLFNEGVGITDIAVQLQRTEPAVYQQIEKLDLYQRKENPQHRKNQAQPSDCLYSLCKRPRSMCPLCEVYAARQEEAWILEEYADILTTEEACEALRIGYNAIYELLNIGKRKGYRNGRVWRIPKAAVQEYILTHSNPKLK